MHNNQQQPINPILHECWIVVNTNKQQYLPQDKILQWLNRVLAQKNMIQQTADINIKEQFKKYLEQIHKLEENSVTNVKFSYHEAVQFYQWIVVKIVENGEGQDNGQEDRQQQEQNNQNQQKQQLEQQQQKQHKQNLQNSKINTSHVKNQIKNNSHLQKQNAHQKANKNKTQQKQNQQQTYLYPHNNNSKPVDNQEPQQNQNEFADQQQNNENPTDINQTSITKNYRQYLLTIFEHYCRMSYATGNDPTFQQIQQKTQVMTINKFMMFCKQFGVIKLNGMGRTNLVQIFKKNAEFYKEMAFQQFLTVLIKISKNVYGEGQKQDNQEIDKNKGQSSKQFQQFLLFLQVNNFSAFKKKAQSLNIAFRAKVNPQSQAKKVVPTNYKFKFSSSGGKTEQQVKQQIQERKRIRSQNKLKIFQNRPKIASSKKDIIKIHQQRDLNDRPQIKSSQPTKKLAPPIPPARKATNSNHVKNVAQDPTIGVTGYANIHKLKLMGKQGVDSRLKLNSIVQQAKKMVNMGNNQQISQNPSSNRLSTYNREITPNSNYSQHRNYTYNNQGYYYERDLAQSQQSNYSQRDLHVLEENPISKRSYAPHGHNQLQKRNVDKNRNEDIKAIIGDQDSDKDEFLEQHLNRQKKTGNINMRIQKKIKQLQLKDQN